MNWHDLDVSEKALGGAGVIGFAVIVLQKAITFFRNEQATQSGSTAVATQFESLRLQIKSQDARIAAQDAKISMLLTEMQRQDTVIHRQQTKLTRTEMLVRQLAGLITDHSIAVPGYIKTELDDLITSRDPETKTRASDRPAE